MTKGILTQVNLPDGTTRFASIISVHKKISYIPTRKHVGENELRNIVVKQEAAVAASSFPLAFVTPKLVIQYAPGLSKGHLNISSFAEVVGELLACPNLMKAHKGELAPALLQIIGRHRLLFDQYVMRSLVFLRIPILVLMERRYFALERSDGKCFVIEPTDTGFIYWDNYKPTRIKDPTFEFNVGKPYQVKPAKGRPPVKYTMRDARMLEVEANVPIGDRSSPDYPDARADFSDASEIIPPQSTNLITPEDEASYGNELIDLAMRAAKEAMVPELNAVRQETMSQLAAMGANDTCSIASPPPIPKLITPKDEEDYGTELIDLAKRAANDAVSPELNALRYELLLRLAAMTAKSAEGTASVHLRPTTDLLTPEDEQNYGEELVEFAKRAAKDAMVPELNAVRQEFLSRLALMADTTMTPTSLSELTWSQIRNRLTTIHKVAIASAIAAVGLLFMFRYELVPTNRMNIVIQLDRWTGTRQMCILQADRTFKCGN